MSIQCNFLHITETSEKLNDNRKEGVIITKIRKTNRVLSMLLARAPTAPAATWCCISGGR